MIGRLVGRIVEHTEVGALVVDVAGVGYEVATPLGTQGRLSGSSAGIPALGAPESDVTIFVHTHVREDAITLFGFASLAEREAFRVLIGIANVGPKLALSVLGAVTLADLAQIVVRGDTAKLTGIPGVGKKTAERLVLELKGKLLPTEPPRPDAGRAMATPTSGKADLVTSTLTRMGFRPAEAERAVASLAQTRNLEDAPLGELVREALAVLSR